MVKSVRGVQQSCNVNHFCYCTSSFKILKVFRVNPPVPGAKAVSFIDDITIILPPELSLDKAAVVKVPEWLQGRRGVEDISLNRRKLKARLKDGVGPGHLKEEQRTAIDDTGLMVVRQDIRVVGVPVRT